MRSTLSSVGRVGLTLLLVVSMALSGYAPGGGPVGEAAASHNCDLKDAAINGVAGFYTAIGETLGGGGPACDVWHEDSDAKQVYDNESQQDHLDIYQGALSVNDSRASFYAMQANYHNESDAIAWMKAEKAIAECYETGNSKSACKSEARSAIGDYYSIKQINHIQQWNATIQSLYYLGNRAQNESSVTKYAVTAHASASGQANNSYTHISMGASQLSTTTVTLANGSTATSSQISGSHNDVSITVSATAYSEDLGGNDIGPYRIKAVKPNSNYNNASIMTLTDPESRWADYQAQNDELQSEAGNFTDAIWADLEAGTIDPSDVISRTTTMFEYGTAVGNGSADYYDYLGATAAMGVDTPDLNETGTMTITAADGTQYDGMLFGPAPNGTWTVGTEYDPANLSGPVQFATTDGDMMTLDHPFTLDRATDKQGNERSSVETQKYNYQTSNTAGVVDKYAKLLNATAQLQARSEQAAAGGGGSVGGTGFISNFRIGPIPGFVVFFGLLAGVVYLLMDDDGSTNVYTNDD
jgi:hypothetical protein